MKMKTNVKAGGSCGCRCGGGKQGSLVNVSDVNVLSGIGIGFLGGIGGIAV
jgi:hypothetical protein